MDKLNLLIVLICMVSCLKEETDYGEYLYPSELINAKDSFLNKNISVRGTARTGGLGAISASLCKDGTNCCNSFRSGLFIKDSMESVQVIKDTCEFNDSILGCFICYGSVCDYSCDSIKPGFEYIVTGTWIKHENSRGIFYALQKESQREIE